jgi:hypothetical protein
MQASETNGHTAREAGQKVCLRLQFPIQCGRIMNYRAYLRDVPLPTLWLLLPVLAASLLLGSCRPQSQPKSVYPMGERAINGPIVYNVIQTVWKTDLGDALNTRTPQNRFLLVTLSATNGGGQDVALPFFTLEGPGGKEVKELENGEGVEGWFGLLRTLKPAETHQGVLLFDAPLTSYRLRLTDGGEPGSEKYVWVDIPLRIDTDTSITVPVPGQN